MMNQGETNRRRFIRYGALAFTASVTGCIRLNGDGGTTSDSPPSKSPRAETSQVNPGRAEFAFEYFATESKVEVTCTTGASIDAGDIHIRSTDGPNVPWPSLGSTTETPQMHLSKGSSAILAENIINWEDQILPTETIRLVYQSDSTTATLARYSPPQPETVTTTIPTTESDTPTTSSTKETETTARDTKTTTSTQPTTGKVIDNFETGSLEDTWRSEFDTSTHRTGQDGGRDTFSVQSQNVAEGAYSLRGDAAKYGDGTSTILRDDFTVDSNGASISFYLKLGPVYTGSERANVVRLLTGDINKQEYTIQFRGKYGPSYPGYVSSEKLQTIQPVRVKNIRFDQNRIEEVTIGGETIEEDIQFQTDTSSIGGIRLLQGHYAQDTDLIIDDITIHTP
jgi:hypothetical protein